MPDSVFERHRALGGDIIKEKVHDIAKLALEEGARITLESVNF